MDTRELENNVKTEHKEISFANFNCTFGNTNEPMLKYFKEILLPAFSQGFIRKTKSDASLFFTNVRLLEIKNDEFVLVGNFVKETKIEIKTHFDAVNGLIPANEIYPTSPYSIFIIFLRNHRMVFYRNQKGSPLLAAFKNTAIFMIRQYLGIINKDRTISEKYPGANINVVSIPSKESLLEKMKELTSIQFLEFQLFPLNGDVDILDAFSGLRKQLNMLESKNAKIRYNSPKKEKSIIKLIADTSGVVATHIKGKNKSGNKLELNNDSYKEKIAISIDTDSSYQDITDKIIVATQKHPTIQTTSSENQCLYLKCLRKLRGILNDEQSKDN